MKTFTNKAEAISYMRQLECHLAELAGVPYQPYACSDSMIYALGSMGMACHGLYMHVCDVDLGIRSQALIDGLQGVIDPENFIFQGVPIDFGPDNRSFSAVTLGVGELDVMGNYTLYGSIAELSDHYTHLRDTFIQHPVKALKYQSRLDVLLKAA